MNINFDVEQANTYAYHWLNFNLHSFHSDHILHSLQISSDPRSSFAQRFFVAVIFVS